MKLYLLLPALAASAVAAVAADNKNPFQELVRSTDPLTPVQQRATFHLPPGFEIQLVASEPDLRKPMNMQWDVLGRLWITESREYPSAVKAGESGRDTVRIFSDFGPDGRARKIEVFADGLNIPIGVYPFRSPGSNGRLTWKCIVWSIPNIWLMEDTDGDGKADKREVLFGPLGWERDTHGNLASFRRGSDGWLYGTHGFNNVSTLKGRDGSELQIQSGNTWRVRLDGSRVEGNTWGQVNPFGLCWDNRGNLFSADCHSSPIYQLLRGASYPSFGKPDNGLGFGPTTITHSHGSTAICAPMYVCDTAWPADLQDHMFIGNVATSRINHDKINWEGSSSKGKEMPDFVSTDDPWFRPVDLSWGPDGALYIADFYNRIIGHYEVPLSHPGRDRERGRLWRIVYRGEKGGELYGPLPTDIPGWLKELGSANLTRRTLALNELCDHYGAEALPALKKALGTPANAFQKLNVLWALSRLGALESNMLLSALKDADALVRTHAVKISRELPDWQPALADAVRNATTDPDAFVRRNAAESLGAHPDARNVAALTGLLRAAPAGDDHLIHSTRIALRKQLSEPAVIKAISLDKLAEEERGPVLDMLLASGGEAAAECRMTFFESHDSVPSAVFIKHLPSLVANVSGAKVESLVALARRKFGKDKRDLALGVEALVTALEQRRIPLDKVFGSWGPEVVHTLLSQEEPTPVWTNSQVDGLQPSLNPWAFEERQCSDGKKMPFMSSRPNGEPLTGKLRSPAFKLPEKLSFFVCGHDGPSNGAAAKTNFVRLRDAATNAVLREAAPPRNDIAQKVTWDLAEFSGRSGVVEVTDGNSGAGFAWIAFGRFDPELPQLGFGGHANAARGIRVAVDLVRTLKLKEFGPMLTKFALAGAMDPDTRTAAARALLGGDPAKAIPQIATIVNDSGAPAPLREKFAAALAEARTPAAIAVIATALRDAPHRLQQSFAMVLAGSPEGAEMVLAACAEGKAPALLLRDKALVDRLKAAKVPDIDKRLATLTANLPPANAVIDKLIATRRADFNPTTASAARGADVFARNCAVCHTIEGKGGMLGPQLDGIGGRGSDRLLEDILDPNRNVDRAFRMMVVTLKDKSVVGGLFRGEQGAQIVFADAAGKESRVAKDDIVERKETETSLMPPSFGETIPRGEFNDLLAFLLGRRPAK